MTDISALKAEARAKARTSDLSYCQALDTIARRHGHAHWKALVNDPRTYIVAAAHPAIHIPIDAARRASEKLNAWISSAIHSGCRPAFEDMICDRYAEVTPSAREEMAESARVNLDQFLRDEGAEFGDRRFIWNRDLANEIADRDIEVWPQFV